MPIIRTYNPVSQTFVEEVAPDETGHDVPAGGTAGQVLRKASSTDYDAVFSDVQIADVAGLATEIASFGAHVVDASNPHGTSAFQIGALSTSGGTLANVTAPATPASGVAIYSESNRLKAKQPSGRVVELTGDWSSIPAGYVTITGNGALQVAATFTIPAGVYEAGDFIEIGYTTSFGSAVHDHRIRLNGGSWAGNGAAGDYASGMTCTQWQMRTVDASTMVAVFFNNPYGGGLNFIGQVGLTAPIAGAALTIDLGISPHTVGATTTLWHAWARLTKKAG